MNQLGEIIGVKLYPPSNESRSAFFIRAGEDLKSPQAAQLIDSVVESLSALWKGGSGDREALVGLLEVLTKRGLKQDETPFIVARQYLLTPPETDEEFRAAANFCEKYPDAVSGAEREALRAKFVEFASDHPLGSDDDPDTLRCGWRHRIRR